MNKDDTLQELTRIAGQLNGLESRRDALVVQALALGATGAETARAAGVSRSQLYNMRNRHRNMKKLHENT